MKNKYTELCRWLRSAIKLVLRERRLYLNKDLGQHLMTDCSLGLAFLREVRSLNPKFLLEIGSGSGFLTRFLVECSDYLTGVDIDHRLLEVARELLSGYNVDFVCGDGLEMLRSSSVRADVVVSNTPYYISTPLLINFIKSKYSSAVLTLQKEVADRLVAKPGDDSYCRLSVMSSLFLKVKIVKYYSPSSFYPRPQVHTALVSIRKIRSWDATYEKLEAFLACIFSQQLRKAGKVIAKCIERMNLNTLSNSEIKSLNKRRVFQLSPAEILDIYLKVLK